MCEDVAMRHNHTQQVDMCDERCQHMILVQLISEHTQWNSLVFLCKKCSFVCLAEPASAKTGVLWLTNALFPFECGVYTILYINLSLYLPNTQSSCLFSFPLTAWLPGLAATKVIILSPVKSIRFSVVITTLTNSNVNSCIQVGGPQNAGPHPGVVQMESEGLCLHVGFCFSYWWQNIRSESLCEVK